MKAQWNRTVVLAALSAVIGLGVAGCHGQPQAEAVDPTTRADKTTGQVPQAASVGTKQGTGGNAANKPD